MPKLVIKIALCAWIAASFAWGTPQTLPVYRITVVGRTVKAVNYRHRSGTTKIDFQGTALMPTARGSAKVESRRGDIEVQTELEGLEPAQKFGPEYLTYVLWAITPEGRPKNLGEILLSESGKSKITATTDLQAFGLIVTAEPYFAVSQPSDVVVAENIVRSDTLGRVEEVEAKYELLQRGQYLYSTSPSSYKRVTIVDRNTPLELYEARNALEIAGLAGARTYAADSYEKAAKALEQAEAYRSRKAGSKPVAMMAREAAQAAEDARLIAIRRVEEQRLANERLAAADRETRAREQAAAEARRRSEAEAAQRAEADRRAAAEAAQRAEADRRATAEANERTAQARAEAARLETEKARADAARAEKDAARAEKEKEDLRAQLLQQLNLVLETRETARGLIVNMSDVLFDTGKYTLRPGAREKLAKVAGILLVHPGLRLEVEGHTDSVGGEAYNQRLSGQRAFSVRDYLVQQGIPMANVAAAGFGLTRPVASNDTAAGRQMNRRVELVVSGDIIGRK